MIQIKNFERYIKLERILKPFFIVWNNILYVISLLFFLVLQFMFGVLVSTVAMLIGTLFSSLCRTVCYQAQIYSPNERAKVNKEWNPLTGNKGKTNHVHKWPKT